MPCISRNARIKSLCREGSDRSLRHGHGRYLWVSKDIRHFGILANGCRKRTLEAARYALGCDTPEVPQTDPENQSPCPQCGGSLGLLLYVGHKPLTGLVLEWLKGLEQARAPPQPATRETPAMSGKHARNPAPRCPGTATPPLSPKPGLRSNTQQKLARASLSRQPLSRNRDGHSPTPPSPAPSGTTRANERPQPGDAETPLRP